MGKNLEITEKLEKYINNFSLKLNPIQQEIIDYNNTLGDVKRMQVAISQCQFLHLIIKISNIKKMNMKTIIPFLTTFLFIAYFSNAQDRITGKSFATRSVRSFE